MPEKERITITLPPYLLKEIDAMIDRIRIRNRSHAIETLISNALGEVDTALIAAAGNVTRSIAGTPLIEHILYWLRENNIKRVFIATPNRDIEKYVGDGSKLGLKVIYSFEREPMGSAGCLVPMKDKLNSTFILVYGDVLTDFDLRKMIRFHKESGGLLTVALKNVENPSPFGVAELEGTKIASFSEKPERSISHLINTGVFVIEPQVLQYITPPSSLELDVIPKLIEMKAINGYPITGKWQDLG